MPEDSFASRYAQLNEAQKKAVDTIDGPLLVIAGPGSGKTELLSLRVANILHSTDIPANAVLCLTYTEAGATNMRQRLAGLIGHQAYQVTISTFHGFCTEIINRYGEYFYNGADFQPADDLAQIEILQDIFDRLSYNDPLAGRHLEAHVYLRDVRSAIGNLKKAGLSPEEFAYLLEKNALQLEAVTDRINTVFDDRLTTKSILPAGELVTMLRALAQADQDEQGARLGQPVSILTALADTLDQAVEAAKAQDKSTPLSEWKRTYMEKDATGNRRHRDVGRLPKLHSLAVIYAGYQQAMHARRFYDYDDMVLDVLAALDNQPALRYAIQEQYQYVLVDEFQDTNDAQMRLLGYVTDAEVYEGRPNIMAVGDDDQAIYKFQGANLANVLQFRQRYRDPELVVLTQNYRSSQHILDLARQVINQGQERLETLDPTITKELVAAGQWKGDAQEPILNLYATKEQELVETAAAIRHQLEAIGSDKADTIAIIGRHHTDLESMARQLEVAGIPFRYDRQRDALREPHIRQLIQLARFVHLLASHRDPEADYLLPEILSYPFWKLDRDAVWKLSIAASQATEPIERLWLWQMEASGDADLTAISGWFKQLRLLSATEPAEALLEHFIGAHTPLLPDEDGDDQDWLVGDKEAGEFISPFKEFYFPASADQAGQSRYVGFLSGLQAFVKALRAYRPGQPLSLTDLLDFVDLHVKNDLSVTDRSVYATGRQAIQLMTAHGAKGLEFDTVYLLSCVQPVWSGRGHGNLVPFPANLPIAPEADATDDQLRLFFVALTRARRQLILGAYRTKEDDGKEISRLEFLVDAIAANQITANNVPLDDPATILVESWKTFHHPPLGSGRAELLPLVEDYKLSLTHLNDFLDVSRGGPQEFLEQHLLRFPEPKSSAQAYGTAVHRSLQELFTRFRHDTILPSLDFLLQAFDRALAGERLSDADYGQLSARGQEELMLYYDAKSSQFRPDDLVERNFANQQVMVGNACLTGKIDRIVELSPGHASVHDIKTGHPSRDWRGGTDLQKAKLGKYRRQLLFYKLLVENARDYAGKLTVEQGILEFVEPADGHFIELPLDLANLSEDLEQLELLIQAVYRHIIDLDFPDISAYPKDSKGIDMFIADLIEGLI